MPLYATQLLQHHSQTMGEQHQLLLYGYAKVWACKQRHTTHFIPTHLQVASGATPVRRAKVPLEKGYSQVAWLHLARGNHDLAGVGLGWCPKHFT